MREIKFRGKDFFTGKWVFGSLIKNEVGDLFILTDKGDHRVVSESVGQFTGLLDKTCKEIYEGDIVKDINDELQQVKWLHSGWGLQRLSDGEKWGWCIVPGYDKEREFLEIIGNIFDNPELLSK